MTAYSNPVVSMFKVRRPPDAVAAVVVLLEARHLRELLEGRPLQRAVEQLVQHLRLRVALELVLVALELVQAHPVAERLVEGSVGGPAVLAAVEAEPLHFLPSNLKPWPVSSMSLLA